ncbi:MAG: p-cresol methylhydroxylase [SAR86 cluster bacterium]|uniref:p-cresol methylhydroxylase n=1 Tax=SAR86 cluster bacterium TaxID=2030880 RepID=A0A2A5CDZ6_9GAMM|nr:FAD-binding oxidoreductase [Gammaproteobacteria bacterium AH-315-E17]PCJ41758.1 MAG: p-cresol methylhydroxylase [SAR86 cluster bacterium]
MPTLPPGVNNQTFETALNEFRNAIGAEWVFTTDEDVDLYRDAYSPFWGEEDRMLKASAAVAPISTEEVQVIVRIANQYQIPLYPISTGKNLGYGGSAPNLSGSVIVDLKRMNQIIEVSEDKNYAVVEPGVSYFDLYNYINERGLKVWIDCPDPGWGSPVGNALDRGVGYTYNRFRDHFGSSAGLEAVLPNGEVMRTGMGALPNGELGNYRYGFGPGIDGLFCQGNFGIVTKMAFHLLPEPEAYYSGQVIVPRRRDLGALVNHVNNFEDLGLIGQPEYGSPAGGFGVNPEVQELMSRPGGATDDELDALSARRGVGSWSVNLQFYGPEESVLANWAFARRKIAESIDGAQFEDGQLYRFPMSDEEKRTFPHRVAIGVPNMEIFRIVPQDGLLYFSALTPRSAEAIFRGQQVFGEIYREMGLGSGPNPYQGAATWHPRAFILINGFSLSRTDTDHNARVREAFSMCIQAAAAEGWGEYRAPPAFATEVMNAYSFNNNILRRFCEELKDGIDPNGIIAPGRGGIWPRYLREDQA